MNSEDYKRNLLASGLKNTEEITLPSGIVFKMRSAPIREWTALGVLPASLASKMVALSRYDGSDKNALEAQVANTFTKEDYHSQQLLTRKLMEYCCVDPVVRLERKPDETDVLIVEDIEREDLAALLEWIWSGGKAARGLHTFRKEPGSNAVAGTDSQ